ncbi:MAG: hypothetical protein ACIALR_07315, partial [Blastopirellula sp. JB062]
SLSIGAVGLLTEPHNRDDASIASWIRPQLSAPDSTCKGAPASLKPPRPDSQKPPQYQSNPSSGVAKINRNSSLASFAACDCPFWQTTPQAGPHCCVSQRTLALLSLQILYCSWQV